MALYTNPPLAGRPPYATDEPDSVYAQSPQQSTRRIREKPADPNARTSAYDVYDNYMDGGPNRNSGVGALGLGLMNMEDDDDDEDDDRPPKKSAPEFPVAKPSSPSPSSAPPIPLAAPRPGYPAPVAGLTINRPAPTASPEGRQPAPPSYQQPAVARTGPPQGLTVSTDITKGQGSPYGPKSPVTPHPLQAPMTPILPAFARPPKAEVKFAKSEPIMRSNSEDMLIPKRGERGDDFWRRFSMVVKEENKKPYSQKQSTWLKKTQNGSTRLSRVVWFIGIILVLCIAAASTLGWYLTHNKPSHQQPTAIGGSANERQGTVTTSSSAAARGALGSATSSPLAVHPTNTVARRGFSYVDAALEPAPTAGLVGVKRRHHRRH